MKKVLSIFILIVLIVLSFNLNIVNATDGNELPASVNVSYQATKQDNQIIFSIRMGDFANVPENSPMKATATLDFDTNHVDTVKGEAYEGWNVTVSAENKTVEFTTDSATPNIEIGKIIFNLDPSRVTETTNGKVAINSFTVTNDNNLNETYPRSEMDYSLVPGTQNPGENNPGTETPDEEEPNENTNTMIPGEDITIDTEPNKDNEVQIDDETDDENVINSFDETMVKDTRLPQTGANIVLTLITLALFILAIVGIVKYKTSEINKK